MPVCFRVLVTKAADAREYALHHGVAIIDPSGFGCVVKGVVFILVPQMPGVAGPFVEMRKGESTVSAGIMWVDLQSMLEKWP